MNRLSVRLLALWLSNAPAYAPGIEPTIIAAETYAALSDQIPPLILTAKFKPEVAKLMSRLATSMSSNGSFR